MATREKDVGPGNARDGGDASGAADPRGEKNEKVLYARISGSLDREIKRRARALGMSVSTVVRNILLNTFDLFDDIVTDSTKAALSVATDEEAPPLPASRSRRALAEQAARASYDAGVLGWQDAVLNVNAVCGRCNAILAKGNPAAMGIREVPGPPSIICMPCLAALRPQEDG